MRTLIFSLALFLFISPAMAQNVADPAMVAIQNRDYATAIELTTRILASPATTDREKLLRYFQRGFANFMSGHSAEAVTDLTVVIDGIGQVYPPSDVQTPAYKYRGLAYGMLKKSDEAVSDLKTVIQRQPDNADAFNELAEAFYSANRTDEAIAAFNEAIKLKPDLVSAYAERGENYLNKSEFDLAIADFTEAIRLKPDFAMAYDDRGVALTMKGRYEEALKDHEKSVALDPRDIHYLNRGFAHLKLKQWQLAIDDLSKAISLTQDPERRAAIQTPLEEARQGLAGQKSP
ncbi:MAG: tetratricopeptide repeat protein [Alphaproteobacteria bacterium]|nr:tetratricopeptide repeat protein [Alphaproteobacteria bacterium]